MKKNRKSKQKNWLELVLPGQKSTTLTNELLGISLQNFDVKPNNNKVNLIIITMYYILVSAYTYHMPFHIFRECNHW